MNYRIGIVTVLYNSSSVLDGFYESLCSQTYKNFVVYAIDNKSSDNSVEKIKYLMAYAPFETVLFEEQENWGIAKGNNVGIKKALEDGCNYVLLANNDIEFSATTIEVLLQESMAHNADMSVPKILYYGTNKIWMAGGEFKYLYMAVHYGSFEEDHAQYDKIKQITYAPTCFMLIKSEVFNKTGFMDEKYFVYVDDADFVYRAVIKNNKSLFYLPNVIVEHKVSSCTSNTIGGFSFHMNTRNTAYFVKKHYSIFHQICFMINITIKYIARKAIKRTKCPSVAKFVSYIIEGYNL